MSLDQSWYVYKDDEYIEIAFHQNIPSLETFMAKEWSKYNDGFFYFQRFEITEDIIMRLEQHCIDKTLHHKSDDYPWSFYEHRDYHYDYILESLDKVKKYLSKGYRIYYRSWW